MWSLENHFFSQERNLHRAARVVLKVESKSISSSNTRSLPKHNIPLEANFKKRREMESACESTALGKWFSFYIPSRILGDVGEFRGFFFSFSFPICPMRT